MMEILVAQTKAKVSLKMENGNFLGAFFDDAGLGTQTVKDHFVVLEEFLKTCLQNNIRIKLSKCEFLTEKIDYLGYHTRNLHPKRLNPF